MTYTQEKDVQESTELAASCSAKTGGTATLTTNCQLEGIALIIATADPPEPNHHA